MLIDVKYSIGYEHEKDEHDDGNEDDDAIPFRLLFLSFAASSR